jgi:predicted aconitase/predicted aconitase with swiveling domain
LTKILITHQPISLLDGIDRKTGKIIDKKHELFGQSIAGVELHFPKSTGSTVGVMTLIELKENQNAPLKIVLEEPDTNVIAGCILANIPVSIQNQPIKEISKQEIQKISHLPSFIQDLLIKEAEILGAEGFIPIERVQIAGVSYKTIGEGGIKVIKYFADKKLKFVVPTTLNPAGMDLKDWQMQGISPQFAEKQMEIINLFKQMGAELSVSCIPYDLSELKRGSHVAFGESSAVAFVNSVSDIRTNRENAVKTLISALSGFTTYVGMHLERNRIPDVEIRVECKLKTRSDYGALGYFAGLNSNQPYYKGITPNHTQLKALAAAGAASGSISLFFIENIPYMKPKTANHINKIIYFTEKNLSEVYKELNTTSADPELISIGCPHLNLQEIKEFSQMIQERIFKIPVWISTAHLFKDKLKDENLLNILKRSNISVYSDCCVVVSPIQNLGFKVIGTDSAKAAKYLPLFSDCDVVFKSIEEFIELYSN